MLEKRSLHWKTALFFLDFYIHILWQMTSDNFLLDINSKDTCLQ